MKFSKETLTVLKNFASINGGIVLKQGNFVMTRSVNSTIYAEATIADEIDSDLAIYDLNAFLSIMSLADDNADITLNKSGDVLIKNARSEINWPSADPSTIVSPKKPIVFPEPVVSFDISGEDFGKIMRMSRGLGADTLAIKSDDGKIVINAYNKIVDSSLTKPLYTYNVSDYDGTNNFNFIINILNMKFLTDDYTVNLWANGELYASQFKGKSVSYVIAVEVDSSHDF